MQGTSRTLSSSAAVVLCAACRAAPPYSCIPSAISCGPSSSAEDLGDLLQGHMPECTLCGVVKPLEAFSDAQLLGKLRCLSCSNPRLHLQKCAEGLEQRPLSELGRRQRGERVKAQMEDERSSRECTGCKRLLPRRCYSSRQLSSQGHGRCHPCAAQATANNIARQAKRRREEDALQLSNDDDTDDELYAQELMSSVEKARAPTCSRLAEPLGKGNAGHRLLQKLGWEPGDAIGVRGHGDALLRHPPQQQDRRGLGHRTADEPLLGLAGVARPVLPEELQWEEQHEPS